MRLHLCLRPLHNVSVEYPITSNIVDFVEDFWGFWGGGFAGSGGCRSGVAGGAGRSAPAAADTLGRGREWRGLDPKPAEEQFDLPNPAIHLPDDLGRDVREAGQQANGLFGVAFVEDHHLAEDLPGRRHPRLGGVEPHPPLRQQPGGDLPGGQSDVPDDFQSLAGFDPQHEVGPGGQQALDRGEAEDASVGEVQRPGFDLASRGGGFAGPLAADLQSRDEPGAAVVLEVQADLVVVSPSSPPGLRLRNAQATSPAAENSEASTATARGRS